MKKILCCAILLCICETGQATWTGGFIAYSSSDNSLYRLTSGLQATKIGTIQTAGYPATNNGGLTRASDNSAYMTERFTDKLYTVNLNDASMISIIQLDSDMQVNGRGLDVSPDGILYGFFAGNELRTVNPQTGHTTFLVKLDGFLPEIESIAFAPNGTLYAGNSSGLLYTLNMATGATSPISSTIIPDIDSLSFAPDGYLYAADSSHETADLYQINPLTGSVVNLGNTGILELNGLMATPEPTSIILLGIGALLFKRKKPLSKSS